MSRIKQKQLINARKERFIAGGMTLVLIGLMIFTSRMGSGVSAAEPHGITGTGNSSNKLTVSDFPIITDIDDMGGAALYKRRSTNNTPTRSGNYIQLTNSIPFADAEIIKSSAGTKYARVSASADVPMALNMRQSWVLRCGVRIPGDGGKGSQGYAGILFQNSETTSGFVIGGGKDTGGKSANRFKWATLGNINGSSVGDVFNEKGTNTSLPLTQLGSEKNVIIKYNASDGSMTCNYGSYTASMPASQSNFKTYKSNATIKLIMMHNYVSGKNGGSSNYGAVRFQSFEYTDYDREITDTQLLDEHGRNITGPVGDGHTVTVQHNVKGVKNNIFAAITPLDKIELPVNGQSIRVNGNQVSTSSGDLGYLNLVPGSSSNTVNTISYRIETAAPDDYNIGDTFSISARLRDDYIYNAVSNKLPLFWPDASRADFDVTITNDLNRRLVSKETNEDVYDYYIEQNPNKYGWNNNDIVIRMPMGSDFEYLNVGSAESSNNSYAYGENTDKTGNTVKIYGRNGTNNTTTALSAVSKEVLKVDKIKPSLEIYSRKSRTLKAADANSGIKKIEWRNAEGDWKVLKDYSDDSNNVTYGPAAVTDAQYSFDGLGTYEFKATDYADNVSDILTVGNNKPEITAKDKQTTWYEVTQGFHPLTELQVKVSDKEETLAFDDVNWTINRAAGSSYPVGFTEIKGSGDTPLSPGLPMGKYEVKLTCEDSDENKVTTTVLLTVKSNGAPAAIRKSDSETLPIVGSIVYMPDGSEHAVVRDRNIMMVDQDNPYSDGEIDKDEAAEEAEKLYSFVTSYSGGSITPNIKITKNGVDYTNMGINTKAEGEYIIHYQAVDNAGNSVTLELTWEVREDYLVNFDPGKGDFADSSKDYTVKVKIGASLDKSNIPPNNTLISPIQKTFVGWSTDKKAEPGTETDPTDISFKKDTTLYAVYADDLNKDGIDDRLQALFEFETSDTENTAFAQGAETLVGAIPETGDKASVKESQIPKIIKMPGCYLKGWSLDGGSIVLSTEELSNLQKPIGSYTKVTAVFDLRTVLEQTEAELIYYSSDPVNAPLDGGDGNKISLLTVDSVTPVKIGNNIPGYNAKPGYVLDGFKTSETGDQILTEQELSNLNIYGGNQVSCMAYFKYDPRLLDKPVTFRFYSGDRNHAPLKEKDGFEVKLTSVKGAEVSLKKKQLPQISLSKDSTFNGWQTSITGDKILTTEELCKLTARPEETVTVIACTGYKPDMGKITGDTEIIEKTLKDSEILERILKEIHNHTELGEKIIKEVLEMMGGRDTEKNIIKTADTKHSVQFAFFSSNLSKGIIAPVNGTTIVVPTTRGGSAELGDKKLPAVKALTNHTLIGWQTSLTGKKVISTKELYNLKAKEGTTVVCTAVFDLADVKVVKDGTDIKDKVTAGILSTIEDEKVPLANSVPGWNRNSGPGILDSIKNCVVHYIMLAFIFISLFATIRRMRLRKNSDYPIPTGRSDWLFTVFCAAVGILLVLVGTCILEVPLFAAEMLLLTVFMVRMKLMDRRDQKELQEIQLRVENRLP